MWLMNKLLILFFCLFAGRAVYADSRFLVIDFTDGTHTSFQLADRPELTFGYPYAVHSLIVTAPDGQSIFELADVDSFHFEDNPMRIVTPSDDGDFDIVWQDDNIVVVPRKSGSCPIRLYSVDGADYSNLVVAEAGRMVVLLASLPKGIYLVNISNRRTIKIQRR